MSKSSDLARSSAKGGFNILWGMILSSVISAVGTVIIGNALGDDFGLISIVLSGPLMITFIRDFGINQAIVKYATQYRTENKPEKNRSELTEKQFAENHPQSRQFCAPNILLICALLNCMHYKKYIPQIYKQLTQTNRKRTYQTKGWLSGRLQTLIKTTH